MGKKVTKMCFSKGGILWRFVMKICLIKRSTEVIRTQWQNILQDSRMLRGGGGGRGVRGGGLRRNLRTISKDTKTNAYISMVLSNLDYCAAVWGPQHKEQSRNLKMVQRHAALYTKNRYINTSSVSDILNCLQWETTESRRTKQQLTMLFKIVNNLVDISPGDSRTYVPVQSARTRSAHTMKFRRFSHRTDSFKFSFFFHQLHLNGTLFQLH